MPAGNGQILNPLPPGQTNRVATESAGPSDPEFLGDPGLPSYRADGHPDAHRVPWKGLGPSVRRHLASAWGLGVQLGPKTCRLS